MTPPEKHPKASHIIWYQNALSIFSHFEIHYTMKAYIIIKDDKGDIQAEAEFDAGQPYAFRQPSTKKLTAAMPQNSDNAATGFYELFGFTYQPHLRVERPNGWKEPPAVPWQGVPTARPNNGQIPSYPGAKNAFNSSLGGFNGFQKQGDPTPLAPTANYR